MAPEMSEDFIEVYEAALSERDCTALIRQFEASGKAIRGQTGGGVNTRLKDSWDICIDDHAEWGEAVNLLNTVMMTGLMRYVRRYPQTMLGPLTVQRADPASGKPVRLSADELRALPDQALQHLLVSMFRPGTINLQKYEADQGGYPTWHCEAYPQAGDGHCDALHRVLLWSVYLNEGFEAGETEFLQQQRAIAPARGALLIAPAGFTHTHRGNRPIGGDKYIATSWVLFRRAEQLFPNGQPGANG